MHWIIHMGAVSNSLFCIFTSRKEVLKWNVRIKQTKAKILLIPFLSHSSIFQIITEILFTCNTLLWFNLWKIHKNTYGYTLHSQTQETGSYGVITTYKCMRYFKVLIILQFTYHYVTVIWLFLRLTMIREYVAAI